MIKDFMIRNVAQSTTQARALLYTLEGLPLPLLNRLITQKKISPPTPEQQKMIIEKAQLLLKQDSHDFASLGLPLRLLKPESVLKHFPRFLKILGDSTISFLRRKNQQTRKFSKVVKNIENYPDYYQRNFHHQTDGYLSDRSAHLYEHQVELLFRGLAEPMRRRLLKPLVQRFQGVKNIQLLELGCGTGVFTRALAQALPEAQITALDLSPNYIKYAKKCLVGNEKVDFILGNAEALPFKDNVFDGVVSVYLHHELPQKVREDVIKESHRVCKEDGFWGMLDSIQKDDDPDLNFAIVDFPKTFHEPFFKNYITHSISQYLKSQWPKRQYREEFYLLSKVIYSS